MPALTANEPVQLRIQLADGQLSPHQYGFLEPSDPTMPIKDLRERFWRDGYLYVKGLLPREHALKARAAYFRFLYPSGILKEGTEPEDGTWNSNNDLSNFGGLTSRKKDMLKPKSEQAATFSRLIAEAHTEEWYAEDFCKHPNLPAFIAKLTEWKDVQLFQRSLLRCNIPHTGPIGVHYDQIFLRQGDVTNITAWCAMGDVKVNGGGLMYLEKSKSRRPSSHLTMTAADNMLQVRHSEKKSRPNSRAKPWKVACLKRKLKTHTTRI
jgi:phytanoyl-CoA hydroxylase